MDTGQRPTSHPGYDASFSRPPVLLTDEFGRTLSGPTRNSDPRGRARLDSLISYLACTAEWEAQHPYDPASLEPVSQGAPASPDHFLHFLNTLKPPSEADSAEWQSAAAPSVPPADDDSSPFPVAPFRPGWVPSYTGDGRLTGVLWEAGPDRFLQWDSESQAKEENPEGAVLFPPEFLSFSADEFRSLLSMIDSDLSLNLLSLLDSTPAPDPAT